MTWDNDMWRGTEIHTPGADTDYEPYGSDPWLAVDEYLALGLQPVVVESTSWPEASRPAAGRARSKP